MNQQEEMFYSAATSCGGRAENQDNFAVGGAVPFWTPEDPESVFGTLPAGQTNYFLVADGVGGGEAGAEASRRAAISLRAVYPRRRQCRRARAIMSTARQQNRRTKRRVNHEQVDSTRCR